MHSAPLTAALTTAECYEFGHAYPSKQNDNVGGVFTNVDWLRLWRMRWSCLLIRAKKDSQKVAAGRTVAAARKAKQEGLGAVRNLIIPNISKDRTTNIYLLEPKSKWIAFLFQQSSSKSILCFFLEQSAVNGIYTKNPFNFQDIADGMALYRQRKGMRVRPMQMMTFGNDYTNYIIPYVNWIETRDRWNENKGFAMNWFMFDRGYCNTLTYGLLG